MRWARYQRPVMLPMVEAQRISSSVRSASAAAVPAVGVVVDGRSGRQVVALADDQEALVPLVAVTAADPGPHAAEPSQVLGQGFGAHDTAP